MERLPSSGTWEEDYEALLPSLLEDTEPCYILFRLDSSDAAGNARWLLITYVPDNAHV